MMELHNWPSINDAHMVQLFPLPELGKLLVRQPFSQGFGADLYEAIPDTVYLRGRGFVVPAGAEDALRALLLAHFGTDGERRDLTVVEVSAAHRSDATGVYLADLNRRLPFRIAWRPKDGGAVQLAAEARVVSGSFPAHGGVNSFADHIFPTLGDNDAVIHVPVFTPLVRHIRREVYDLETVD